MSVYYGKNTRDIGKMGGHTGNISSYVGKIDFFDGKTIKNVGKTSQTPGRSHFFVGKTSIYRHFKPVQSLLCIFNTRVQIKSFSTQKGKDLLKNFISITPKGAISKQV